MAGFILLSKKQKSMLFGTLEPKRVGWVERSGTQQQLTVVVKILVTLPEGSKDFRLVRSNRFNDFQKVFSPIAKAITTNW